MDEDTYLHYRGLISLAWTDALAKHDQDAAEQAVHALAILENAWDDAQAAPSIGYEADVTL